MKEREKVMRKKWDERENVIRENEESEIECERKDKRENIKRENEW